MKLTDLIKHYEAENAMQRKSILKQYIGNVAKSILNIDISSKEAEDIFAAFFYTEDFPDGIEAKIIEEESQQYVLEYTWGGKNDNPMDSISALNFNSADIIRLNGYLKRKYPGICLNHIKIDNLMYSESDWYLVFGADSERNNDCEILRHYGYTDVDLKVAYNSFLQLSKDLQDLYPSQISTTDHFCQKKYEGFIYLCFFRKQKIII